MKRNVTDFDFIRGAFDLLPKDAQGEIYGATLAFAMAAIPGTGSPRHDDRTGNIREEGECSPLSTFNLWDL